MLHTIKTQYDELCKQEKNRMLIFEMVVILNIGSAHNWGEKYYRVYVWMKYQSKT